MTGSRLWLTPLIFVSRRHCEERSNEAIQQRNFRLDYVFRCARRGRNKNEGSGPPAGAGRQSKDPYASGAQGAPRSKAACAALPLGRARLPRSTRHLRQQPNATAQLQFTRFLGRNELGAGVTLPCRPNLAGDVARRPVVVPAGRLLPGAAREQRSIDNLPVDILIQHDNSRKAHRYSTLGYIWVA